MAARNSTPPEVTPAESDSPREVKAVKALTAETVLAPFAFAKGKNGEVTMLAKGDLVNTDRFVEGKEGEANTLAHLRAIGFIGSQD